MSTSELRSKYVLEGSFRLVPLSLDLLLRLVRAVSTAYTPPLLLLSSLPRRFKASLVAVSSDPFILKDTTFLLPLLLALLDSKVLVD